VDGKEHAVPNPIAVEIAETIVVDGSLKLDSAQLAPPALSIEFRNASTVAAEMGAGQNNEIWLQASKKKPLTSSLIKKIQRTMRCTAAQLVKFSVSGDKRLMGCV